VRTLTSTRPRMEEEEEGGENWDDFEVPPPKPRDPSWDPIGRPSESTEGKPLESGSSADEGGVEEEE
jgi:hypothetical protein